jgi:hypothetical protein
LGRISTSEKINSIKVITANGTFDIGIAGGQYGGGGGQNAAGAAGCVFIEY